MAGGLGQLAQGIMDGHRVVAARQASDAAIARQDEQQDFANQMALDEQARIQTYQDAQMENMKASRDMADKQFSAQQDERKFQRGRQQAGDVRAAETHGIEMKRLKLLHDEALAGKHGRELKEKAQAESDIAAVYMRAMKDNILSSGEQKGLIKTAQMWGLNVKSIMQDDATGGLIAVGADGKSQLYEPDLLESMAMNNAKYSADHQATLAKQDPVNIAQRKADLAQAGQEAAEAQKAEYDALMAMRQAKAQGPVIQRLTDTLRGYSNATENADGSIEPALLSRTNAASISAQVRGLFKHPQLRNLSPEDLDIKMDMIEATVLQNARFLDKAAEIEALDTTNSDDNKKFKALAKELGTNNREEMIKLYTNRFNQSLHEAAFGVAAPEPGDVDAAESEGEDKPSVKAARQQRVVTSKKDLVKLQEGARDPDDLDAIMQIPGVAIDTVKGLAEDVHKYSQPPKRTLVPTPIPPNPNVTVYKAWNAVRALEEQLAVAPASEKPEIERKLNQAQLALEAVELMDKQAKSGAPKDREYSDLIKSIQKELPVGPTGGK